MLFGLEILRWDDYAVPATGIATASLMVLLGRMWLQCGRSYLERTQSRKAATASKLELRIEEEWK